MIELENAARELFEAHRDVLDITFHIEWKNLRPETRNRYRRVVALFLTNMHIPFKESL